MFAKNNKRFDFHVRAIPMHELATDVTRDRAPLEAAGFLAHQKPLPTIASLEDECLE